nr:MAG TPA: NTP-PPase-like protein [Caudoviricetes sp.]
MNTQNLTIKALVPLIHQWAKERKIYEQLTPFDELLKTHEEVGELIKACYDNDKPAIQDAIGDVMVTLINYCYFRKENFNTIFLNALSLKNNTNDDCVMLSFSANKLLIELLHSEYKMSKYNYTGNCYTQILYIVKYLNFITHSANTTLEECLNIAYNEIKNRKGKIINGKFIKDE